MARRLSYRFENRAKALLLGLLVSTFIAIGGIRQITNYAIYKVGLEPYGTIANNFNDALFLSIWYFVYRMYLARKRMVYATYKTEFKVVAILLVFTLSYTAVMSLIS